MALFANRFLGHVSINKILAKEVEVQPGDLFIDMPLEHTGFLLYAVTPGHGFLEQYTLILRGTRDTCERVGRLLSEENNEIEKEQEVTVV